MSTAGLNSLPFPLTAWFACDCAARVLGVFERREPNDDRPRIAVDTMRRYLLGLAQAAEVTVARAETEASFWSLPRRDVAAAAARATFQAAHVVTNPPWTEYHLAAQAARFVSDFEGPWQQKRLVQLYEITRAVEVNELIQQYAHQPTPVQLSIIADAVGEWGYEPVEL